MPIDPWEVNRINFESKMEKIEKQLNNMTKVENKITKLQNLNDKLFKLVDILYRKQENKELLTLQADLLEEYAIEMRELLSN